MNEKKNEILLRWCLSDRNYNENDQLSWYCILLLSSASFIWFYFIYFSSAFKSVSSYLFLYTFSSHLVSSFCFVLNWVFSVIIAIANFLWLSTKLACMDNIYWFFSSSLFFSVFFHSYSFSFYLFSNSFNSLVRFSISYFSNSISQSRLVSLSFKDSSYFFSILTCSSFSVIFLRYSFAIFSYSTFLFVFLTIYS